VKLTAKGRYAVMAVADMAAQGQTLGDSVSESARSSLTEISQRQGISLSFLEQLFGKLRRAGIVESYRGATGGYVLAQSPSNLTLEKIIFAVDEDIKAHGCTPEAKIACTGKTDRCLTHNLWGALEDHIEQFLASITVQDVVDGRFPVSELDSEALEAAE
jgi:Rrf2 family iron-sulfur cluster assembly transcriptional regulator